MIYYNQFLDFYQENFSKDSSNSVAEEKRKDYCYDCEDDGWWVNLVLKCRKCEKILI